MREFQAKKKIRTILYSKTVVVVLLVIFAFVTKATWGVYAKAKETTANVIIAERELDRLKEREDLLNSEIKRLSTDEGIEEEIRSKYTVSKPGEHIIVLVDSSSTASTTAPAALSWWEKVRQFLR